MLENLLQRFNGELLSPALLVGVLAFASVLFVGTGIWLLRERHRKAMRQRLEGVESTRPDLLSDAPKGGFLEFVEHVGNFVSHGHASASLWEQLIRAGFMSRGAPAIYTGIKVVMFLLGLVITAFIVLPRGEGLTRNVVFISLGGILPFFLPNLVVMLKEKQRHTEIQQFLPDVVDLLEICVSSGIGLDMAWNIVSEEIHDVSPVLGTAMDLSNFEMHLGASRTEAMRNMAVRTGAQQLSSLAAVLVQSERFGTSIATALREFASGMREERRMSAEENAEKMSVKLVIPMVLFIFPAIAIVIVGPAAINIARVLLTQ
jgi:tight adherence protein C